MKKIIALSSVAIFATAVIAFAAADVKPELRPAQEIMSARVAWQGAIKTDLGNKNHEAVAAAKGEFNRKCTDCHKYPL
jgi:hypothetical protein